MRFDDFICVSTSNLQVFLCFHKCDIYRKKERLLLQRFEVKLYQGSEYSAHQSPRQLSFLQELVELPNIESEAVVVKKIR